ncbi:MAG: acylphosphatase [Betaproteobacteria bacterium]
MNDSAPDLCRHLLIHGLVQGVGFRWSLGTQARQLGLTGWVRNRRDGSVEALICGSSEAVEALTRWAHQGPPSANVSHVVSTDHSAQFGAKNPGGFEEKPSL